MEATCLTESERQAELEDSVIAWQDKYDRLYESHKRVQKVNQSLEDKLLKLVDRNTGERAQLTSDVATLSVRLAQANFNISKLQRDIERYKTDINLAIQLLQCKPDGFVPQKISSLPIDIQSKVSSYMRLDTNSHSDSEGSITGIGIISTTAAYKVLPATDSPPPAPCPFPPTAMVYSMRGLDAKQKSDSTLNLLNNNNNNNNSSSTNDTLNNNGNNNCNDANPTNSAVRNTSTALNVNSNTNNNTNFAFNGNDMISPVVMAKFLEDELKAGEIKHCDTCQCSRDLTVLADVSRSYSVATQTPFSIHSNANLNDSVTQLCLRCYSNLNSPSRTNSPFTKNLLKSSDSVISETKSSVSDLNEMDKLFTPAKKDDLMVNPILGHHRLCERTSLLKGVSGQPNATKTSYNTILDNLKSLNGYQRRFVDGGGTALELLEERSKLLNPKQRLIKSTAHEDLIGNDDMEDEEKPLLGSSLMHSNHLDAEIERRETLKVKTKLRTESSCELGVSRDHIKSPTTSTKSALNTKATGSLKNIQISGSVNSVWSKTSSCEGAKMFENFNRNLIKTIKAENPKYRGPRLCSMRIQQNGQSNILLDNIESIEAITPVIYRRRERLLDEELDDGKDIITSHTSMETQAPIEAAKEATETEMLADVLKPTNEAGLKEENLVKPAKSVEDSKPNKSSVIACNGEEKTDNLLEIKMETAKPCLQSTTTTNYDIASKISGTQSSSISENIDFQETVILRRQQLSRVAEWVQNNTQQMEMEHQKQQQQQQQHLNPLNNCDSSGTDHQSSFSTLDQLDSVSVEKLSVDSGYKTTPQLPPITNSSQDETVKTSDDSLSPKSDVKNQSPLNFPRNSLQITSDSNASSPKQQQQERAVSTQIYSTPSTYYRRTTRSGLPVAFTATQDAQDSGSQSSQIIPEQPTCDILNYKYYPNDSDKTRAIKAELHTTTQSVDIAQMEYNVKQFLLKQNEWSMRTTTRTQNPYTNSISNSASAIRNSNAVRNIKLFTSSSSTGMGPGKGERIRTTINQHNTTPAGPPNTIVNSNATASGTKFNSIKVASSTFNNNSSALNNNHTITTTATTTTNTKNCPMPQRTETNL